MAPTSTPNWMNGKLNSKYFNHKSVARNTGTSTASEVDDCLGLYAHSSYLAAPVSRLQPRQILTETFFPVGPFVRFHLSDGWPVKNTAHESGPPSSWDCPVASDDSVEEYRSRSACVPVPTILKSLSSTLFSGSGYLSRPTIHVSHPTSPPVSSFLVPFFGIREAVNAVAVSMLPSLRALNLCRIAVSSSHPACLLMLTAKSSEPSIILLRATDLVFIPYNQLETAHGFLAFSHNHHYNTSPNQNSGDLWLGF
ncbi:hypothetical protein R3P38DRAFT_3166377 [Favolaschia claudopus]|uniref:Uncharacterized protein n=1 Tax=Favolaschia claudopus TaxID=2862362 RepID=A0AAW0EAK7_9AGAR